MALVSAACGSPTAPRPPDAVRLPAQMRFTASAEGHADGHAITCRLDFIASLRPVGDEMHGTMGGEAQRARTAPDGSGEAFRADAHYPDIRIAVDAGGQVHLASFRNGVADPGIREGRFWDQLTAFGGVYDERKDLLTGIWVCRPLDTRGDVSGDITGTWTMQPMP